MAKATLTRTSEKGNTDKQNRLERRAIYMYRNKSVLPLERIKQSGTGLNAGGEMTQLLRHENRAPKGKIVGNHDSED